MAKRKEKPKPKLEVVYTDGWNERVTLAAIKLYEKVEARKRGEAAQTA